MKKHFHVHLEPFNASVDRIQATCKCSKEFKEKNGGKGNGAEDEEKAEKHGFLEFFVLLDPVLSSHSPRNTRVSVERHRNDRGRKKGWKRRGRPILARKNSVFCARFQSRTRFRGRSAARCVFERPKIRTSPFNFKLTLMHYK